MRRIVFAGLASLTFAFGSTQMVSAADLSRHPVRRAAPAAAPAPAQERVANWTGFYSGGNAGGGFENTIYNTASCISDPGGCLVAAAVPGKFDTRLRGFIGGGQIGYNWQTGLFVWGVETDFQGADIKGNSSVTNTYLVGANYATVTGSGSQKIDWFGTFRGRLGWTPAPPVLLYATGGLAYGHVKTAVSFSGNESATVSPFPPVTANGATGVSLSDTRAGWTVGGGVEWMFAAQWSVKGEYLYYDLGSVNIDQTLYLSACCGGGTYSTTAIHSEARYHGSIARIGVNYKFF